MANEEQLAILKQGVDVWNQWRDENPGIEIDLSKITFTRRNLEGINLYGANLYKADVRKTSLHYANLRNSNLGVAFLELCGLSKADLTETNLQRATLRGSNLSGANLANSILFATDLTDAILYQANLTGAELRSANLQNSNLSKTNLSQAILGRTVFGNVNLSKTKGLEDAEHQLPSVIDGRAIQKSTGNISVNFLRGCGLSDIDIEYAKLANPDLDNEEINMILYKIHDLRITQPIQLSPLFISYSHADSTFVDKLETKLNDKGVRFWRDIHDATAGRLETQIDRAIRHNPTVLLVLSEHSTSSDWVEHEARLARKLEKELGRDVLCPIALDDSWKTCNWPERIKEQIMEYNILDFSNWEDDDELDAMFKRLIDGLDMFYKK